MRESRTYGSVRGALSNERPYRNRSALRDSFDCHCRALSRQSRLGRHCVSLFMRKALGPPKRGHRDKPGDPA